MIAALHGGLALRILGAVDEAAEIASFAVAEGVDLVDDVEQAVEARGERPPRVEQARRIAVRQVDPQRVLRRRERRQIVGESPQPVDGTPDAFRERRPDTDHRLRIVLDRGEGAQHRRRVGARMQGESDVAGERRRRFEDRGLGQGGHGASIMPPTNRGAHRAKPTQPTNRFAAHFAR